MAEREGITSLITNKWLAWLTPLKPPIDIFSRFLGVANRNRTLEKRKPSSPDQGNATAIDTLHPRTSLIARNVPTFNSEGGVA